ncbi:MAG: hypothetical protein IJL93_05815 [Bacteroidales bacterium]|nr:hypothetical protein [Bacteroidales bacterium]
MNRLFRAFLLPGLLLLAVFGANAQTYSGPRQFDGVHRNEFSGNLAVGYNVVSGWFIGQAGTYTRHFTDRWSLRAGEQVQVLKWLFSADVMGTYRLPFRHSSLYFDARLVNNVYTQWDQYELIANASAFWETSHFDLRLGMSYIRYYKYKIKEEYQWFTDAGYTEPPTITFGVGLNMLPRTSSWNLGLFLRNYDQFYYENWNINWGLRFYTTLPRDFAKIFGEFNIRPAGSLSQLATRYETSLKLGIKYVW